CGRRAARAQAGGCGSLARLLERGMTEGGALRRRPLSLTSFIYEYHNRHCRLVSLARYDALRGIVTQRQGVRSCGTWASTCTYAQPSLPRSTMGAKFAP